MNKFYFLNLRQRWSKLSIGVIVLLIPIVVHAQQPEPDSLLQQATLENVVDYAIKHQPMIQQSLIDQETTEYSIRSRLADWYPQLNFNYNVQHNFVLQPTFVPKSFAESQILRFGAINTSQG